MEVHAELGHGFLERVYHDALCHEFDLRGIPYESEVTYPIMYKGMRMKSIYRADLICYNDVVVELKAVSTLTGSDTALLLNYLKASNIHRGVLLNFGSPKLQYERRVWGQEE